LNVACVGVVDAATVRMMRMPRCGVGDMDSTSTFTRRRKRYATTGALTVYYKPTRDT